MNETLKMVKFDFITVKKLGADYFWKLSLVCVVLSLIGLFPAAMGFLFFPLGIFSPITTVRKGDFMKIYGLLPVKREYVTKALFMEIAVPQLIGGIICELLLVISKAIGESHILPAFLQEHFYDKCKSSFAEYNIGFNELLVLAAAALALITIVVLFFYMLLEIKGETFAMACCIPFVFIIGAAVIVYIGLFAGHSSSMPTLSDIIPESTAVRIIVIIASFLLIAAAEYLLCGLTVKKTADKEL